MKPMIDSITSKKKTKKVKFDTLLRTRLRRVIRPDLSISSKIWSFAGADKKSAALVLTLIVTSISMVIVLIISQLVIKELILARKLEYSTQAFQAAQGGIEFSLKKLKGNPNITTTNTLTLPQGEATYSIKQEGFGFVTIESQGEKGSVLRKLKVQLKPENPNGVYYIAWDKVKFNSSDCYGLYRNSSWLTDVYSDYYQPPALPASFEGTSNTSYCTVQVDNLGNVFYTDLRDEGIVSTYEGYVYKNGERISPAGITVQAVKTRHHLSALNDDVYYVGYNKAMGRCELYKNSSFLLEIPIFGWGILVPTIASTLTTEVDNQGNVFFTDRNSEDTTGLGLFTPLPGYLYQIQKGQPASTYTKITPPNVIIPGDWDRGLRHPIVAHEGYAYYIGWNNLTKKIGIYKSGIDGSGSPSTTLLTTLPTGFPDETNPVLQTNSIHFIGLTVDKQGNVFYSKPRVYRSIGIEGIILSDLYKITKADIEDGDGIYTPIQINDNSITLRGRYFGGVMTRRQPKGNFAALNGDVYYIAYNDTTNQSGVYKNNSISPLHSPLTNAPGWIDEEGKYSAVYTTIEVDTYGDVFFTKDYQEGAFHYTGGSWGYVWKITKEEIDAGTNKAERVNSDDDIKVFAEGYISHQLSVFYDPLAPFSMGGRIFSYVEVAPK